MDLTVPPNERKVRVVEDRWGEYRRVVGSGVRHGRHDVRSARNGRAGRSSAAMPTPSSPLDRETLKPKDWFTAPGADFNATPIVIRHKDKDLIAATANDGRLYLLDAASLGGSDHKTPLAVTAKFTDAGAGTALATFEDENGRWILRDRLGSGSAR